MIQALQLHGSYNLFLCLFLEVSWPTARSLPDERMCQAEERSIVGCLISVTPSSYAWPQELFCPKGGGKCCLVLVCQAAPEDGILLQSPAIPDFHSPII